MNEAQMHIADTVHTTEGSYSEVLLLSSKQSTVFRFIPIEAEKVAYDFSGGNADVRRIFKPH